MRIDYPDKAREIGDAILGGAAERGVLVCGSGVGAAVAACKIAGIRAAICHDVYSAHQGVEHDDMNVLCLGSEVVGPSLTAELVRTFLGAQFNGGERYVETPEEDRSDGKGDVTWLSRTCTSSRSAASLRLDRLPLEGHARAGRAGADDARGRRRRRHLEPDDLPEGDRLRRAVRRAAEGALEHETDPKEIFLQLSARDVEAALDLLAPVHEQTGYDGFVSWEVDPTLAYDREGTFDEAMRLHAWIDSPNLYVKIPATKPGLGAIEDCIAHGKNINVTLIFSLQRYAEVVEAYLRGLERLVAGGGDPAGVHSVASFFVSRVDTEADRRLEEIGTKDALALRGRLAVANAKLAYEHYGNAFSGPRWEYLAGKGANPQRCLWASTSTKNPGVPRRDLRRGADRAAHGEHDARGDDQRVPGPRRGARRHRREGLKKAHALLEELAKAGVDYDDVTETLELEGVQKFADSFAQLLDGVQSKRDLVTA